MKKIILLLCLSGLSASISCQSVDGAKGVDLFASGDFSGWSQVNGEPVTEGWRIKNGVIHRYDDGGDIITREKYKDFELSFEWKISEAGNSGV